MLGRLCLRFRQDDGTCSSIVSEQCVKDMENEAMVKLRVNCECPNVANITSCDKNPVFSNIICAATCKSFLPHSFSPSINISLP